MITAYINIQYRVEISDTYNITIVMLLKHREGIEICYMSKSF